MSVGALPLGVTTNGLPPGPDTDTFVLLHGYGGSSFSWRTWVPFLSTRGHVVAVDLKGFGRAPAPDDGRYAPTDHAELVVRLLLEDDLGRITLVGHSFGGGVALLAALALHDAGDAVRLRRLVLVAGAAYAQPLPPFVTLSRHPRLSTLLLRTLGPEFIIAQALRSIVFDRSDITGDQVRGYAAPLREPGSWTGLLESARMIVPAHLERITARYPEIDVPTLLLWGRHDRVVPLWVAHRLASALPHATLRILERCGHVPAEERPEESLAALRAFLDAV